MIPYLLRRMDKAFRAAGRVQSIGGPLPELPIEVFKGHVHVVPFPEDDIIGLVQELGADRVLLGSDFPHPEGLAEPSAFLDCLGGLRAHDVDWIARGNGAVLLGLGP